MSISVRVPEEIEDYKEKIIGGLSVRQIVCCGAAFLCGVTTFLLLFKVNKNLAAYATMIVVIPAFCVGFVKKDGYNFETYLKIKLHSFFGRSKRSYETKDNPYPVETEKFREEVQNIFKEQERLKAEAAVQNRKRGVKFNDIFSKIKNIPESKPKSRKAYGRKQTESRLIEVTAQSIKRKRKAAAKSLKAAGGKVGTGKPKAEKQA